MLPYAAVAATAKEEELLRMAVRSSRSVGARTCIAVILDCSTDCTADSGFVPKISRRFQGDLEKISRRSRGDRDKKDDEEV